MKKYSDYKSDDSSRLYLDEVEMSKIKWTKFNIVVPTKEDAEEIRDALKHFHDADIDTDYITVNQLAHEYLEGSNIRIDPSSFKHLHK